MKGVHVGHVFVSVGRGVVTGKFRPIVNECVVGWMIDGVDESRCGNRHGEVFRESILALMNRRAYKWSSPVKTVVGIKGHGEYCFSRTVVERSRREVVRIRDGPRMDRGVLFTYGRGCNKSDTDSRGVICCDGNVADLTVACTGEHQIAAVA